MTRRATTQAIAAAEPTGDSDAVRIRHQLDAWANASNRTPRLVATPTEDVGVEPSGEAPLPATKRGRAPSASGRTKAAKGTKAKPAKAKAEEVRIEDAKAAEAGGEPEAPDAPLELLPVFAAPAVPIAVP